MTLPALALGFIISTLFGVAFHLFSGGGAGRLLLDILMGWIGFWAGHILASLTGWTFGSLGPLHLGLATLGAMLFLGIGYWLSQVGPEPEHKKNRR